MLARINTSFQCFSEILNICMGSKLWERVWVCCVFFCQFGHFRSHINVLWRRGKKNKQQTYRFQENRKVNKGWLRVLRCKNNTQGSGWSSIVFLHSSCCYFLTARAINRNYPTFACFDILNILVSIKELGRPFCHVKTN